MRWRRWDALDLLNKATLFTKLACNRVESMQAVADAWSLLANTVMAWNTSQVQAVLDRGSTRRHAFPPELIGKIATTRLESMNLSGVFGFAADGYADQILLSEH
jgi:hypothetical protein